jgi:hypothetical protein
MAVAQCWNAPEMKQCHVGIGWPAKFRKTKFHEILDFVFFEIWQKFREIEFR